MTKKEVKKLLKDYKDFLNKDHKGMYSKISDYSLNKYIKEQLFIPDVVKSLKVEETPTFNEYTQAKGYKRIGNSNVYKKEGTYKDAETLKKQYQVEHYF